MFMSPSYHPETIIWSEAPHRELVGARSRAYTADRIGSLLFDRRNAMGSGDSPEGEISCIESGFLAEVPKAA